MLVGRITKETGDLRRVLVSFAKWADAGEAVSIAAPTIAGGQVPWSGQVFDDATTASPTPADTSPLTLSSATILADGVTVQLMLASGTPGVGYTVTFVATGSTSGRKLTVELEVAGKAPS